MVMLILIYNLKNTGKNTVGKPNIKHKINFLHVDRSDQIANI